MNNDASPSQSVQRVSNLSLHLASTSPHQSKLTNESSVQGRRRMNVTIVAVVAVTTAVVILNDVDGVGAFLISRRPRTVSTSRLRRRCLLSTIQHMSTIGGGSDDSKYGGDNNDDDDEHDSLREWIMPPSSDDKNDPEGVVRRSREEARAESRLPVSFGAANNSNNDENGNSNSEFGSMI